MSLVSTMAAAQTVPLGGDIQANIEQHLLLIRAAAQSQARLIVFPELSLTGYELDLADELAFSEHDVRLSPLTTKATSTGVTAVVGAPVRLEGRLHIGAFILSPSGTVQVYTKHQLGAFSPDVNPGGVVPPAERTVFAPGEHNPLLSFNGVPAALGVCAETLGRAHVQAAANRGAKLYLTSHFGIPADGVFRAKVLRDHALRHNMPVLFANYGGPTGGLPASGRSAIWSERGACVAQLGQEGAGLVIATRTADGWQGTTIPLSTGAPTR